MTKFDKSLVLVCIFVLHYPLSTSYAQTKAEFQWRNESEITLPIGTVDLEFESELDLTSSLELDEWQVGPDVVFPLAENLSGAIGYLFEISSSGDVEHGPQGTLSLGLPQVGGFRPSVRNRITFGRGSVLHRYRGRFQVQREKQIMGHPLNLFVRNEVWFGWSERELMRNRFTFGGSRDIADNLSVSLGYQWEVARNVATIHRLNIGFNLIL